MTQRGSSPLATVRVGVLLLLGALLFATACATAPPAPISATSALAGPPAFDFGSDTLSFRNEVGARHPEDVEPDVYAHHCFVLARGLRQFFQFARFEPDRPRVSHEEYVALVRAVVARRPWEPPLPPAERVVIPGYPHLRAFSAAEEAAVKEGLGGPLWTWLNWTNWRVTAAVGGAHQEHVAGEVMRELARGHLVQLLVTNWPIPELNHTVIAYRFAEHPDRIDFTIWDPNETETPGTLTFDRVGQRFWATDMYATRPGVIRAFRMYFSPFL